MARALLWIVFALTVPCASAQEFYEIRPHLAYAAWDGEPGSTKVKDELYKPFDFSEDSYYVRGLPENCFDLTEVNISSPEISEIYAPNGVNMRRDDAYRVVRGEQINCWTLRQYYESQIPEKNYFGGSPLSLENMQAYGEWVDAISAHYQTDAFFHISDIPAFETYNCDRLNHCKDYLGDISEADWTGTDIWLQAITDVNQDGVADAIIISRSLFGGRWGYTTGAILTRRHEGGLIEALSYFPDRINVNPRIQQYAVERVD